MELISGHYCERLLLILLGGSPMAVATLSVCCLVLVSLPITWKWMIEPDKLVSCSYSCLTLTNSTHWPNSSGRYSRRFFSTFNRCRRRHFPIARSIFSILFSETSSDFSRIRLPIDSGISDSWLFLISRCKSVIEKPLNWERAKVVSCAYSRRILRFWD